MFGSPKVHMMGSGMLEYTFGEIIFCVWATFRIFYFLILCSKGDGRVDCRRKDFAVNFGRAASDACSATWNLGPYFAFILVLKERHIHLNYVTNKFPPQRKQRLHAFIIQAHTTFRIVSVPATVQLLSRWHNWRRLHLLSQGK